MRSGLLVVILSGFLMFNMSDSPSEFKKLDKRVQTFLDEQRDDWHDWNVPYQDGKILYDLIMEHKYTKALEIGTSTGHSAIWMAWALKKTGGTLITIEIDERRYELAQKNFRKAGVDDVVDARLADAHQLVKELEGPFDFVFSDADKVWYKRYLMELYPKLEPGGCFVAHNVRQAYSGIPEFMDFLNSLPDMKTRIDSTTSSGMSVSFKKSITDEEKEEQSD